MASSAPSITRDTFDADKAWEMLTQIHGQPVFDAVINHNAKANLWKLTRRTLETIGYGHIGEGFEPIQSTASTTNNFSVRGGGIIDPFGRYVRFKEESMAGTPAQEIQYQDQGGATYDNYLVRGRISAFDDTAKTITDSSFLYVAEMAMGSCKLKMLTGALAGTVFTIASATGSVFTLSGAPALAALVAEDEYVVYPEDLTTPGGARTDDVYLMTWFEHIDERDDTDVADPFTQIAGFQAWQLRWCIRVDENQAGAFSSQTGWDEISYMKIGELNRTASAAVVTAEISWGATSGVVRETLQSVGNAGFYSAVTLQGYNSLDERLQAIEAKADVPFSVELMFNGAGQQQAGYFAYYVRNGAAVHTAELRMYQVGFPITHYTQMPSHDHGGAGTGNNSASHTHDLAGGATAVLSAGSAHAHILVDSGAVPISADAGGLATGIDLVGTTGYTDANGPNALGTSSEAAHSHTISGLTDVNSATHNHTIPLEGRTGAVSAADTGAVYQYADDIQIDVDGNDFTAVMLTQLGPIAKLGDGAGGTPFETPGTGYTVDLKALHDADGTLGLLDTGWHVIRFLQMSADFGGLVQGNLRLN